MRWRLAPTVFRVGVLLTALAAAVLVGCLCRLFATSVPWWPFLLAGSAVGVAGLWLDRWASRQVWPGPSPRLRRVLFYPASFLWAITWSADEWRQRRAWPRTVDQAVDILVRRLDKRSLEVPRSASDQDVAEFHFSLGMGVRNDFGLWAGNRELLEDCGDDCPEIASGVIVRRLIQRLRRVAGGAPDAE